MTTYALVNPQGVIDRQASNVDPRVGTKEGWKWLPVVLTAAPKVTALETATASFVALPDRVLQEWVVRRKPLEQQIAAVKAEAQRRIIALTGKVELLDCMIKQSNANMRANELNDKRISGETLTEAEEAEATALRNLAIAIKAIRAKSNAIEAMQPIPLDYTADGYWA